MFNKKEKNEEEKNKFKTCKKGTACAKQSKHCVDDMRADFWVLKHGEQQKMWSFVSIFVLLSMHKQKKNNNKESNFYFGKRQ